MSVIKPLTLTFFLLSGCGTTPETEPEIDPIGPELYSVLAVWVGVTSTLYRDDLGTLQLLRSDSRLEVVAELTPETLAALESEFDAFASGETTLGQLDVYCLNLHDADQITLTLPGKGFVASFSYPWSCAPPGLATIDEILGEVLHAMSDCSPSKHLESCEVISAP